MCDGLREQVSNLQSSCVTESDVSPGLEEVFSPPPDLSSPAIISYSPFASSITGLETSRDDPQLPIKLSTTPSSTTESYSGTSQESLQLDPKLVATGQASNLARSIAKACGHCREYFNGSEQLL